MDALELLKRDHDKVNSLFQQFVQGGDSPRFQQLFEQLYRELTVHTAIEETVFYPAIADFRETAGLVKEAYQEHAEAKNLLVQLSGLDNTSSEWTQKINKLMQDIQYHVAEEEGELFPRLRLLLTEQQRQQLGQQLEQAKASNNNMTLGSQPIMSDYDTSFSHFRE